MREKEHTIIPPGGFAGFAQQTAAAQALVRPARMRRPAKKRRKKAAGRKPAKRKTVSRRPKKKRAAARLVKGSPAAKRHMAKLRAMQGKRRGKRRS